MTELSTPRYPGSMSHNTAYKAVTVVRTNLETRKSIVRDEFGRFMEVRCDIMRAKGNLPQAGEVWIIDRQYDIWVFGAILNASTDGVAVNTVTGLPEAIDGMKQDQVAGDSSIINATYGKATAKGDLLAATGPAALARLPVSPTLNQALVADPSTTQGLAYRDVCGRPVGYTGLPGATAAGRFVGHTAFGSPTTGTFSTGDWITTQSGYQWVCTAGGSPGTWVCRTNEVDLKVDNSVATIQAQLDRVRRGANHSVRQTGASWGTGRVQVSGMSTVGFDGGIATLRADGIVPELPGKWCFRFLADTNAGATGIMTIELIHPSIPWGGTYNIGWRGGGFSGGGRLAQDVSWVGYVSSAQAGTLVAGFINWTPSNGTTGLDSGANQYRMEANYLGHIA